jgi:hypothetical protein
MLDWLASRFNDFVDFMWRLVLSLFDMLKDFFIWIMEQLSNVGLLLLDSVGSMLSGLDISSYWGLIPPETAYFLNVIGISQAVGMIVTCLGIRFLLQIIPFVRWGS